MNCAAKLSSIFLSYCLLPLAKSSHNNSDKEAERGQLKGEVEDEARLFKTFSSLGSKKKEVVLNAYVYWCNGKTTLA